MIHLNYEQFEGVLENPACQSEHLAECPICRHRLEELRAVRGRLQAAFASVTAPAGLAERIRAAASGSEVVPAPMPASRPLILRLRRFWPLAAAAAILVMALPLTVFLSGSSSAQAAQQELVNIHRHNLTESHTFFSEDEPGRLAQYFKDNLGFAPAMPKLNQGMAIRGCCTAHFKDKIVGSYVVDTPHGAVSIIVIGDPPEAVGLSRQADQAGKPIWTGHMTLCNIAAVRMGDSTYTAVSEIPQESLIQLLGLLVP